MNDRTPGAQRDFVTLNLPRAKEIDPEAFADGVIRFWPDLDERQKRALDEAARQREASGRKIMRFINSLMRL